MNLALEITLVVLVCIGVTYSAPASVSGSDAVPTEKPSAVEPVTSVVDHAKTQTPLPSTTIIPPAPIAPVSNNNTTQNVTNKEVPVEENKTITPIVDNKTVPVNTSGNATMDKPIPVTPQNTTANNSTVKPTQAPVSPTQPPTSQTTTTEKPTTATATTTKPTTPSPISAQTTAPEHAEPVPAADGRQFDGPSFTGGIVLTVGLTAIGFIAFKFYKSGKLERNYRTL